MRAIIITICGAAVLLMADTARADRTKKVRAEASKLTLFTDGKGHYLVTKLFEPRLNNPMGRERHVYNDARQFMYYGDGKKFYFLDGDMGRYLNKKLDEAYLRLWFMDPRVATGYRGGYGIVKIKDGPVAHVECAKRRGVMKKVSAAKAAKIIARAKFYDRRWKRRPHSLARDFRGNYYYVDQLRSGMGFRFFIGRRGRMKKQKLIDAISDTVGTLFVVKRGSFQVSQKRTTAKWINTKNVEMKLTSVPVKPNRELIHNQLGIYDGKRFGTPCDDH